MIDAQEQRISKRDRKRFDNHSNNVSKANHIWHETHQSLVCEKCKTRKATDVHHVEFDPKTNKSNKDGPTIKICARCHAEIHGNDPNTSEIRTAVLNHKKAQQMRIAVENIIRSYDYLDLLIPEPITQTLIQLKENEKLFEKEIKFLLDSYDTHTCLEKIAHDKSDNQNSGGKTNQQQDDIHMKLVRNFLLNIKGISYLLTGQLLAYLSNKEFKTVSKLWAYCGMGVIDGKAPKRSKGKKINWNPTLRMIMYKLSDSFIKQRTPKYRDIYDKEKEKQLTKHKNGECESCNKLKKADKPGHPDAMARRKAVKEFLKDFWIKLNDKHNQLKNDNQF